MSGFTNPRACLPGDKLVYGHIANMPRRQVRSELLAELAAMRDFNDESVLAGREVNRLAVGDVVVPVRPTRRSPDSATVS